MLPIPQLRNSSAAYGDLAPSSPLMKRRFLVGGLELA